MGRGQELLDAAREGDRRTVEKIIGQITKRSGPFTSLRRGAGVNVQDDNGYTPLHHACLRGHKEIVRLLLSVDASPCILDKKGATPLHLAAWKGDTDVVAMLLAHNNPPVVVDHLTSDHESALLIAAQFGYVEVVAQLAAKGADVTLKNIKDESPLDLAAQYGRLETVQYLLRVRPELVEPYKYPMCKHASTPLHRAAINGHKEVVSTLLAAGFNPNVRNSNGTPLHEAACFGKASVVRILLAKGADLNATDRRGKTVHDLLADYSEEATRRVRRVIRDYESLVRTYESEEDLPPFPVPDYSPTGYPSYDMKAPDTQKKSNINSSLSPSSSSLTNQPQSLVQKLASKLGFKSKFNSVPNVNTELESEKPKNSDKTLLIGNSKFFKKLSKKEESGVVHCNDEFQYSDKDDFDTKSLDRLATLSRDSVVNKSNRSCPGGFKTSLPNISENNEATESLESVASSVEVAVINDMNGNKSDISSGKVVEALNFTKLSVFEPRDDKTSHTSNDSETYSNNECYEPYEPKAENRDNKSNIESSIPKPLPRPTVVNKVASLKTAYENVIITPKPAARVHIPSKDNGEKKENLYENIAVVQSRRPPTPPKRTFVPIEPISPILPSAPSLDSSPSISRSSTLSSDSCLDETNLEDILLSEKSKSFRNGKRSTLYAAHRTQSNASDMSDVTQASAIEAVDCSADPIDEPIYLPMTGTIPRKDPDPVKKKVLFRHKTFTNIELDRNSINIKDTEEFIRETIPNYHIRGTGHCIYQAPTVQEFMYIFNRETLYSDVEPFTKVPNDKRDSYFETAICFCKPKPPKHHKSAEDLLDVPYEKEERVTIDFESLNKRNEISTTSFQCFCDSSDCKLHSEKRETQANLVVKFSVIKKSISTPDITLAVLNTNEKRGLTKNKSVPFNLEENYEEVNVKDIIERNKNQCKDTPSPIYVHMSQPSTISSSVGGRYSIRDISDALSSTDTSSLSSHGNHSNNTSLQKSTSQHSGHWSLQSCNSNVTIQSELSFKTCQGSSDDDGTLHSDDDSSDAETVKSDVSTGKRPWVHSDSFRFGSRDVTDMEAIVEESSSKFESGISVGSVTSSEGEGEGVDRNVVLDASLGGSLGVRSGSARRRWEDAEGTSEGDALSVSSAASSCAPLQLYSNKVSPTPPKKPPRRNLSVSPTHANSPSSGYSYELRPHARSQDDLDDIQCTKSFLKQGRSVDQYVDGKLSYSEYEENHNSPRIPIPNPRPSISIRNRLQPIAITTKYENVQLREQNPKRKLRRNNFGYNSSDKMTEKSWKYQERSSLESLLDDSVNSPSDCDRYYEGYTAPIPLSPTHFAQPPTPEHPPPSAKQAENSIHEKIRPLSQEYKRRSALRDSQTEVELNLLRAASSASVASGATDRSGNTDNCVEEYVCEVPFAGLFKGSTTTLDGIGLRPMPAERPKTLRKLKSVYDASPIEPPVQPTSNVTSNGQQNGEDEVRRRSNTNSSNSGDKSLSILSPFDEQEEWAKISEIMASFGSKLVRESVFVSELEQEFTSRLGLSCSESSLSPSVASSLGLWLSSIGLHDYEQLFLDSGYDDIDFINGVIDENDLKEMGLEENDRHKILESVKQLPRKITEISNNHNNNNISKKHQEETVEEWLKNINLEIYNETFRKHLYVDMDRVKRIWEVELTAVLEIQKVGHRKRILASVSGENNGPTHHLEEINADLNSLKSNIQQLKDEIKEKLPENLKAVPPPVVPNLAVPGGETLKRSKKNRPAPQPPRPSDLEIRAPSELLVGVPGALKTQWKHQPLVLVTGAVTYVANYLGSTVVKELRGTESTKKSIQKLKKTTKEPRDSPDIILSISYRGVKFLNTITRELVCEHEIRNIHCACQDADDLTHFAYITKDHATKSHFCHVFRVATMDQATEVILTLGEAFEVAYQMALREQSNRSRVSQSLAKTPTHTQNKEKTNVNHGRSHSITEIKLNGHQLKIAPMSTSLSNEDFQSTRNSDGSRSPKTPLLKAPIASTEEL